MLGGEDSFEGVKMTAHEQQLVAAAACAAKVHRRKREQASLTASPPVLQNYSDSVSKLMMMRASVAVKIGSY